MPLYEKGYISLPKQYLTQGINGLVEGAEFLGIDISPNDEYYSYCESILSPIMEENKKARTKEFVKEIKAKIKANNGYCPCRLTKTPDTKCMCKEFREQTSEGYCHCGLFIKTNDKGASND